MATFAAASFLTLFVIVDPVGLSSLFLGITTAQSTSQKIATARKAALIATLLLVLFLFLGAPLLQYLGVSIDALLIAGGLLLFKLAFDMVLGRRERQTEQEEAEAQDREDVAVFPLAIPLIAGPGAFATVLVLATEADGQPEYVAIVIGSILAVITLVYIGFRLSQQIHRILGNTGTAVVTRVLGLILAALAVQLVIDGAVSAFQ